MQYITEQQFNSLVAKIYDSFIASDDNGLGEMGAAQEEAERIAREWCEDNNIKLDF